MQLLYIERTPSLAWRSRNSVRTFEMVWMPVFRIEARCCDDLGSGSIFFWKWVHFALHIIHVTLAERKTDDQSNEWTTEQVIENVSRSIPPKCHIEVWSYAFCLVFFNRFVGSFFMIWTFVCVLEIWNLDLSYFMSATTQKGQNHDEHTAEHVLQHIV